MRLNFKLRITLFREKCQQRRMRPGADCRGRWQMDQQDFPQGAWNLVSSNQKTYFNSSKIIGGRGSFAEVPLLMLEPQNLWCFCKSWIFSQFIRFILVHFKGVLISCWAERVWAFHGKLWGAIIHWGIQEWCSETSKRPETSNSGSEEVDIIKLANLLEFVWTSGQVRGHMTFAQDALLADMRNRISLAP